MDTLNDGIRALMAAGFLDFERLAERQKTALVAKYIEEYPTACFLFGTPKDLAKAAAVYFRGIANYGRPSPMESGNLGRAVAEGLRDNAIRDIRGIWAIVRADWEHAETKEEVR